MAAAGAPADHEQDATIRGMVDGLAARLKQDGSDPDGWVRLIRSYKVLGESEKASAAAADARRALAGDAAKLQQFNSALNELAGDNAAASAPMPAAGAPADHEQDAAIQGMVNGLAARLKQDGSDADGWVRLIRSYKVLGESEKASAAAADARSALAGDAAKLQQFNAALNELGGDNAAASAPMPAAGAPADHDQDAEMQIMAERLAERLKKSGSDPQRWLILVRTYVTLGEKDKVTAAISDARQALAADPDKAEQFNKALAYYNIGQ